MKCLTCQDLSSATQNGSPPFPDPPEMLSGNASTSEMLEFVEDVIQEVKNADK